MDDGHEYEFHYGVHKYSFSHNENGWYLTEYDNEEYQTFTDDAELLLHGKIRGKSIAEIWPYAKDVFEKHIINVIVVQ